MQEIPQIVAIAAALIKSWLVLGGLFALPFLVRGVTSIDPVARDSKWTFRVMLVPGVVLLWPLLLWRWVAGGRARERNAHLDRARERAS